MFTLLKVEGNKLTNTNSHNLTNSNNSINNTYRARILSLTTYVLHKSFILLLLICR